ncbi:MAG: hypothetical protein KC561_15115 [Myxococcales bacterium]|nr:hypothetical protein [Myxococcales bacterium]
MSEVLNLIENAHEEEQLLGVVQRYLDHLTTEDGAAALTARLDERRRELQQWNAVVALINQLRQRESAAIRQAMETATSLIIKATGWAELAGVAKEYPVVFTGSFIGSLIELRKMAATEGDTYTAQLIGNRLGHLQLLQLAQLQGLDVSEKSLRDIVYAILEASSFGDLLKTIRDNPVVFADALDETLHRISEEAKAEGDKSVPKVAALRMDVLKGIRSVLEAVVTQRAALGGPEDAVSALANAGDAHRFLLTVAQYPFVIGEDFGLVMARELEAAEMEKDEQAAEGIRRRMSHLGLIGDIVAKLTNMGGGDGN